MRGFTFPENNRVFKGSENFWQKDTPLSRHTSGSLGIKGGVTLSTTGSVISIQNTYPNSVETILFDRLDTWNSFLGNEGFYDFSNPNSLEFRGISELYHLVMYKLVLVFGVLVVLACMACLKSVVSYNKSHEFKENYTVVVTVFLLTVIPNIFNILIDSYEKYTKKSKTVRTDNFVLDSRNNTNNTIKFYYAENYFKREFQRLYNVVTPTSFWIYYSLLEFIWTVIPCVILLFISIPSFTLALALDETHKPSLWVKVIGNQWYWIYEYSTYEENIAIYSNILYGSDLEFNSLRLLKPDLSVSIMGNRFSRFLITSADVIHSWAIPSLGLKVDACPGRINSISILPTKDGIYYGQCSEICGVNHAFMPIALEVVS